MIYLTNSAVQYAVNICSELEGYKVVIACDRANATKLFETLLSITNGNDIYKVHDDGLSFKNGSTIRFVPISESARGYKAHLLIVDAEIEDELLHQVLLPMEVLDWYRYNDKTSILKKE